jgi:hypothetical protein
MRLTQIDEFLALVEAGSSERLLGNAVKRSLQSQKIFAR